MARKKGPASARDFGDGGPVSAPPGSSTPVDSPVDGGDVGGQGHRAVTGASLLTTAFAAGRMLNRLGFHLQQAWFWDRDHLDQAEALLGDLGRAVRPLAAPGQRRRFQEEVAGPISRLIQPLSTGDHVEYLMGCNEELNSDDEAEIREYREVAARRVSEAVGASMQVIESRLDDPARLALELGMRLDQGLCRPDICRFLDEVRDAASGAKAAGPKGKLTRELFERMANSPEPSPKPYRNYIAGTSRSPGEVPPDDDWSGDVVQLLRELDILDVASSGDLIAAQGQGGEELAGLIGRLDEGIRAALTTLEPPGESGVGRAHRVRRRPRAERDEESEARARWVYDKCKDTSITLKEILAEFRTVAGERGWKIVGTINGIRDIAKRYAQRHSLPPPPARQGK